MEDNILAVGAHPDDIELGCGGTLAKHLDLNDNIFILILTNGEKGNHPLSMEECFASLTSLGIKKGNIFFGNLKDGYVSDDLETVNLIENYIKRFNIKRVYTHYPNDRHQDHRNCSNAVSSAARNVSEIFLFEGPSTKSLFEPHYFIGLSEDNFNSKINAIKNYKSQIEKGIVNLDLIKAFARLHGAKHNEEYIEAFALNHLIKWGKEV